MICKIAKTKLLDLYYNDLPEGEKNQLLDHLHSCSNCEQVYFKFQSVLQAVKSDSSEPSSLNFLHTRVLARLENRKNPALINVGKYILRPAFFIILALFGIGTGILVSEYFSNYGSNNQLSLTKQENNIEILANEYFISNQQEEIIEIYK